ncbi:MAG: hypothetical protein KGL33_06135 [Betaproteobacteria bacterium]|jgi:hypothetical protein|nr:hypothetical protein [Betaproteobacteria bacterium]
MQQHLDVQHEAPPSLWIAGGIAALAYIFALNFATYWTIAGTCAVAAAISAVRWLRSNH